MATTMKFVILMTLFFGLAVAAPSSHSLTRKVRHQEEAAPVPAAVAATGTANPSRNAREELHLPALVNQPPLNSDGQARSRLQEAAESLSLPGHAHHVQEPVAMTMTEAKQAAAASPVPMELTLPRN